MLRYIIRRLLQAIPTLIGVSIISFMLVSLAPGDPISLRTAGDPQDDAAGQGDPAPAVGAGSAAAHPVCALVCRHHHAPRRCSRTVQFRQCALLLFRAVNYTLCDTGGGVIRGDLGTSIDTKQPVWER